MGGPSKKVVLEVTATLLHDDWGELPDVPPRPKKDALAKALSGTLPVEENPFSPVWLEAGEATRRNSIQEQLALWESSGPLSLGAHDYITLADGRRVIAHELFEQMHRSAYTLLKQGVSVAETAALTHLTVAQVIEIQKEFNLQ